MSALPQIAAGLAAPAVGPVTPLPNGGMVPNLDYAALVYRPPRQDPTVLPTHPQLETLPPAYSVPPGMDRISAAMVMIAILSAGPQIAREASIITAICTVMEFADPGFCARTGWQATLCQNPTPLPAHIRTVTTRMTGVPPAPSTAAQLAAASADRAVMEMHLHATPDLAAVNREMFAFARLALLLFSVHKGVGDQNQTAFTQRRPLAVARAIGLTAANPLFVPSLDEYRWFSAFFSAPAIRVPALREMVEWIRGAAATPRRLVMVSQVRLARRSGLGGYELAALALVNYGAVIRAVPGLNSAVVAVEAFSARLRGLTEAQQEYEHLIYGPISRIHAQGDYSVLTMFGRDMAKTSAQTMVNFGRDCPPEVVAALREEAARAGIALLGLA